LSVKEREGLDLFMAKGCSVCHNGINVGGGGYFPFGVLQAPDAEIRPPEDLGRFKVTNTSSDRYVFKAPSLRNVALTPPYFHSGKVWKLKDAVELMGSAQLGTHLNPDELERIVSFLGTLTGNQPKVEYPVLPFNSNGTLRPILK
jgi:cytochrome c peroxidase